MNKDRLKRLRGVRDTLQEIADEERAALDNMPDALQESERGTTIETNADNLDEAIQSIEQVEGM